MIYLVLITVYPINVLVSYIVYKCIKKCKKNQEHPTSGGGIEEHCKFRSRSKKAALVSNNNNSKEYVVFDIGMRYVVRCM